MKFIQEKYNIYRIQSTFIKLGTYYTKA